MIWLSDWLKSIIIVILLATFVDILLPSQTMQRYVKTVISLFILLTLLQPVFSLFQKQGSVDQMMASAESLFQSKSAAGAAIPVFNSSSLQPHTGGTAQGGSAQGSSAQGSMPAMQTLGSIQQQAEQLKTLQEQRSEQLMQQQMVTLMKQNIEQTLAFKVESLKVETGKDANGQMQIRTINLQVAHRQQTAPPQVQSQTVKPLQVEPVKPIDISIQSGIGQGQADSIKKDGTDASRGASASSGSGFEQEKSQIRMLLSKAWQVPEAHIVVEVSGGKL
jgi:stage III sporulation protein AF